MLRRAFATLIALAIGAAAAHAQIPGQIPSGTVWGNSGASAAIPSATTATAWMDRWCSNTQGSVANRGASNWACSTLASLVASGTNISVTSSAGLPTINLNAPACANDGVHAFVSPSGGGLTCGSITGSGSASIIGPQGRLTLQAATPVMTTTFATQGTLYYVCFPQGGGGYNVPYYTGSTDKLDTIASCQVSTAMAASSTGVLNANSVFDVWWEGNTNHNICIATNGSGGGWASDTGGSNTARGTGYSQVDTTTRSFITNKNDLTHCYNGTTDYGAASTANKFTYLGTIMTDSGSAGKVTWQYPVTSSTGGTGIFNIWNLNRQDFSVQALNNNAGGGGCSNIAWVYNSTTWRQAGGSGVCNGSAFSATTTWKISYVVGLMTDTISAQYATISFPTQSSQICFVGVGNSVTNAASGGTSSMTAVSTFVIMVASYVGYPATVGANFVAPVESVFANSGANCNFYAAFAAASTPSLTFKGRL